MQTVCRLDDIAVGSARGFQLAGRSVIISRPRPDVVRAYLNRCPHLGVPLNWQDDDFMDVDAVFLRCATHGALFEPDSGLCISGPCRGEWLWSLDCRVVGDEVQLDSGELPPLAER